MQMLLKSSVLGLLLGSALASASDAGFSLERRGSDQDEIHRSSLSRTSSSISDGKGFEHDDSREEPPYSEDEGLSPAEQQLKNFKQEWNHQDGMGWMYGKASKRPHGARAGDADYHRHQLAKVMDARAAQHYDRHDSEGKYTKDYSKLQHHAKYHFHRLLEEGRPYGITRDHLVLYTRLLDLQRNRRAEQSKPGYDGPKGPTMRELRALDSLPPALRHPEHYQ